MQQPPLGKYVWEKPSGEQGLILLSLYLISFLQFDIISIEVHYKKEKIISEEKKCLKKIKIFGLQIAAQFPCHWIHIFS